MAKATRKYFHENFDGAKTEYLAQRIIPCLWYITKDHIATHTILFQLKTALFFSFLVLYI